MKYIKRKSAVKPITGSIVDTTNIDDKTKNTYSARVIDKMNTYSTEEQIVGTWINGKPVYRKVIETLPNTTVTFANNVEMAWFKWGVLTVPVGETMYRFPINYSVEGREINAQITNNTVIVDNTFEDWNTSSATIVLEYTKTTD